jgi:hypothetical protein
MSKLGIVIKFSTKGGGKVRDQNWAGLGAIKPLMHFSSPRKKQGKMARRAK